MNTPTQTSTSERKNEITVGPYKDIIASVAKVKDVDVDKLEKLMALQSEWEKRQAAAHYNEMMALAQAEMGPISTDSVNPQTRSKYASLAALDTAIRPIYTKFGFSVTFDEPQARDDGILLVAYVSCGSETRRFTKWIPVSTTGMRGGVAMTPTHAAIGAVTYGKRTLHKMIWNLAEVDSDGNFDKYDKPPERPKQFQRRTATATELIEQVKGCLTAASLERWDQSSTRDYDALNGEDQLLVDQAYRDQSQAISDAAQKARES